MFFNKSQNAIEQHGDDAKDHNGHEYPGKLKEAGMHSEKEKKMADKVVKYEYEYGLCRRMHYRGLWCVRYEGVPGHMEKAGMACICAQDGCDQDCAVLETADPVIDPEWEWHMLDTAPEK